MADDDLAKDLPKILALAQSFDILMWKVGISLKG